MSATYPDVTAVPPQAVRRICARALRVKIALLATSPRDHHTGRRRHVIMLMLRRWTTATLLQISKLLWMAGERTAHAGIAAAVERLKRQDKWMLAACADCEAAIRAVYPNARPVVRRP